MIVALALVFQGHVGAISGSVQDTTGAPQRDAAVEVVGLTISARTDSAGRYRLNGVPTGAQIVHVGHIAQRVTVVADTVVGAFFLVHEVTAPHAIWNGCQPYRTCALLRYVATFKQHTIPAGIGVIRDAATWNGFLARYATGPNESIRRNVIDWSKEMLVVVSYGADTQMLDQGDGINRVERHPDRLTVLLGPDSLNGPSPLGANGWVPATAIAVPRTTLPIEYRAVLASTHIPPTVDWSRQ